MSYMNRKKCIFQRILNAAKLIKSKVDEGHKVVVVVSAMAGVTNDLIKKSKEKWKII